VEKLSTIEDNQRRAQASHESGLLIVIPGRSGALCGSRRFMSRGIHDKEEISAN